MLDAQQKLNEIALMDSTAVELGTFSVIMPWDEPLGPRMVTESECPMEAYILRIWSLEPLGGWPTVGD